MAQQITTLLFDDLELSRRGKEVPADETVDFSLDGKRYKIDLTEINAGKLRDKFKPYTEVATKLPSTGAKPSRTVARRQHSATIRSWAKQQGIPVSERGRIPEEVVAQYELVH
jgi:hypothetical protein